MKGDLVVATTATSPLPFQLQRAQGTSPSVDEWSVSISPAATVAGLGAIADGTLVGIIAAEAFSHIDADFLSAIQFSTAEHLSSLHSIDLYVQEHFFDSATSSADGWLHRLEGYVAEQKAAVALEKAGHVVQFAPSANQPAWDLLVDGHPWQVKEGVDLGGVKDALLNHHDIPIVTGSDLASQIHDPMVHGLHAVDHHAVAATTKESMAGLKDGFHPGVKIPVVTIALSSWREFKLIMDGRTTLERALRSVVVDTFGVGSGMLGGVKLGALAGSWAGPIGAGIGAFILGGALLGRKVSHAYRFKDFNRAYENYKSEYSEARRSVYEKIEHSKSAMRRLGATYQRRFLEVRSDIESRVRVELQKLSASRDAEIEHFVGRFSVYLEELIQQLAQEEAAVLGRTPRSRWWGWLIPGSIELQRALVRKWFINTRQRVRLEQECYRQIAESDHESRLEEARRFLTEYCFELESLQEHLEDLEPFSRPNDPSKAAKRCFKSQTSLYRFVSWGDRKPGGRRSRSRAPPCCKRAGVFPQLAVPARRRGLKRGKGRRNQSRARIEEFDSRVVDSNSIEEETGGKLMFNRHGNSLSPPTLSVNAFALLALPGRGGGDVEARSRRHRWRGVNRPLHINPLCRSGKRIIASLKRRRWKSAGAAT